MAKIDGLGEVPDDIVSDIKESFQDQSDEFVLGALNILQANQDVFKEILEEDDDENDAARALAIHNHLTGRVVGEMWDQRMEKIERN